MSTCLCNNPPAHTTDDHLAIKTVQPNPVCACSKGPAHTPLQHTAIMNSNPVYPAPVTTMYSNPNILFLDQSWGPKVVPPVSGSPWARLWNSGTGDPATTTGQQRIASQIAAFQHYLPGVKLLLTLGDKPSTPTRPSNATVGTGYSDAHYQACLNVIAGITGIAAVEIWNEPETTNGCSLNVDRVGRLAQMARATLGGKKILVGPPSEGHNPAAFFVPFMQKYGSLVDAGAHHIYTYILDGTVYQINHDIAAACMAAAKAVGKPLWVTEWNVKDWSMSGFPSYAAGSITGDTALGYMTQALKAFRDAGVSQAFEWHWDAAEMPILMVNGNRTALTPEGTAFIQLAAKLAGGTL